MGHNTFLCKHIELSGCLGRINRRKTIPLAESKDLKDCGQIDRFQGPEASLSVGGKRKKERLVFPGTELEDQKDMLISKGDCSPELLEESLAEGLAGLDGAATSQWPWSCLGDVGLP